MPKPNDKPGGGKGNKKPEILDQTFSIDENSLDVTWEVDVGATDPEGDTVWLAVHHDSGGYPEGGA